MITIHPGQLYVHFETCEPDDWKCSTWSPARGDSLFWRVPRRKKTVEKKFNLTWAGGLSHLKTSITSVELQHKAREWRD